MITRLLNTFAQGCSDGSFLTFPSWFRNLDRDSDCGVVFSDFTDVWIVVTNVLDILIRLAGFLALALVIWGAIMYILSQGSPEGTKNAKSIIANALIGVVVAILASTIVGFIAGRF